MSRCDRLNFAMIVVSSLVVVSPAAEASNPAKAHYATGQAYYQRGAYAEAIQEFTRAYDLARKPELLYNIGQCHERLGQVTEAIKFFERYLKESGKQNNALQQKIKNLRRRLQQTGIRISSSVSGATVTIDGKVVGTTPMSEVISVKPGQHKLSVSKTGHTTYSLVVSVVAGGAVTINADLERVTTKQPDKQAVEKKDPGGDSMKQSPTGRKRLWTWIAYGVAGAFLTAGAITGTLALTKANSADSSDDAEADAARGRALAADVLLGVGIAAAITGTVLLFVEAGPESADKPGAAVTPMVGPGYVGVTGSF